MKSLRVVTVIGLCLSGNKGGPAILSGLARGLRRELGEDLKIKVLTPNLKEDLRWKDYYGVELCARPRLQKPWSFWRALRGADLVIDMHGVKFCGANNLFNNLNDSLPIWVSKWLGIPVICFTQTYGPFRNSLTRKFARASLQAADLVMARDPGSMASLREIGVHARIYPDIAFEMPATSWNERPLAKEVSTFLEADLPWVGLSLSTKVLEEEGDSRRYEDLIAEFAQKLLDRGERILLLPHTYVEGAATKDDTKFSRGVFGRLHPKKAEDLALIDQDLSPGQLKAIIARAELFVGSRYHALLAALSMGVPSVAIGWNYKYDGLFSLFQHEKYAIPLENLSLSLISDLFEDLRTNQNEIRQRIQKRLPEVLKKVHESVGYSLKEIQRISSEN